MKALSIIWFIIFSLYSCSPKSNDISKIEVPATFEKHAGISNLNKDGSKMFLLMYFPFSHDSFSGPDGKYVATIETIFKSGTYEFKTIDMIDYVKKGSMFTRDIPAYVNSDKAVTISAADYAKFGEERRLAARLVSLAPRE